ncbi:Hypothetical_protein [Hexamita inflata]|uniref:Hypothetical_protein n=1 Tax=Hexamita inflata TaxID=28002 RepID=A0ABP1JTY2_9EUKA
MNGLYSYYNNMTLHTNATIKSLEKKFDYLNKKLEVRQEQTFNLNSTKIQKNKSVPSQLLDNNGDIKSMSAAYSLLFPKEEIEDIEKNLNPYVDYELKFGDLPSDD